MSKEDKVKLDGLANYILPIATNSALGGIKVGYTNSGKNYKVQVDSGGNAYVYVPWTDNNTTYSNMTAATASNAGKAGLVPAPAAGKQTSFLRGDGTWVIPTNTTYSLVSTSANGLMPKLPTTNISNASPNLQLLNGTGQYVAPHLSYSMLNNTLSFGLNTDMMGLGAVVTTITTATNEFDGLMPKEDKIKLNDLSSVLTVPNGGLNIKGDVSFGESPSSGTTNNIINIGSAISNGSVVINKYDVNVIGTIRVKASYGAPEIILGTSTTLYNLKATTATIGGSIFNNNKISTQSITASNDLTVGDSSSTHVNIGNNEIEFLNGSNLDTYINAS